MKKQFEREGRDIGRRRTEIVASGKKRSAFMTWFRYVLLIRRLYYGAADFKGSAGESGVRFFSQPTCHHTPEVYSAVGEGEAATLLRYFFKARR